MIQNAKNLAIALAGLFQALMLVKRTAAGRTTLVAEEATCINSIFNIDPASVEDIYDGVESLMTRVRTCGDSVNPGRWTV